MRINLRPPFCSQVVILTIAILGFVNAGNSDDKNNQQKSFADRLKNATERATGDQSYILKYKLKPGDEFRWNVEHVFTTDTTIAGARETTSCRNLSTAIWKVKDVDSLGNVSFDHMVEKLSFWRKVDDGNPLTWSSDSNTKAPEEYAAAASRIGKVQATFTVRPDGEVIGRDSRFRETDIGIGKIVIRLPQEAIKLGHVWATSGELQAKHKSGRIKRVKTRHRYQLLRVNNGIADISFDTQILTPIHSQQIKSQLMQKMTRGVIRFDIQNGIMISRDIDWDTKVQGFEGADSMINYVARYSESIVKNKKSESNTTSQKRETVVIKHRFDPPILRR